MLSVAVHPPQTPVTKGSIGIARATLPNVCKMPGPPAPFVPTPLPNIGRSGSSPKGYTRTVKVQGHAVAVFGASFGSMGDMASKATGGGIVSMNTHGPTRFIAPGSFTVFMDGKPVQLLRDPMLNNNGPAGAPPNSATLGGVSQRDLKVKTLRINCKNAPAKKGSKKFTKCEKEEICAKIKSVNQQAKAGKLKRLSEAKYDANRQRADAKCGQLKGFAKRNSARHETLGGFKHLSPGCEKRLRNKAEKADPPYTNFSPDHVQEIQLGGHPTSHANLRWMSSAPNSWMGGQLTKLEVGRHTAVKGNCC